MKITLRIPDELLKETLRHTKCRTRSAAIIAALEEHNRRCRQADVKNILGTFTNFMTATELREMRSARDKRHDAMWRGRRPKPA
ncbi:MAG: type II toxin-antitoxin system VapB family antitoxin [Tepidisphaeraceae bacterium]|jgi:hypothetical protein